MPFKARRGQCRVGDEVAPSKPLGVPCNVGVRPVWPENQTVSFKKKRVLTNAARRVLHDGPAKHGLAQGVVRDVFLNVHVAPQGLANWVDVHDAHLKRKPQSGEVLDKGRGRRVGRDPRVGHVDLRMT